MFFSKQRSQRGLPLLLCTLALTASAVSSPSRRAQSIVLDHSTNEASASLLGVREQSSSRSGRSLRRPISSGHVLRVCNAFPDTGRLFVFRGGENITTSGLSYKSCEEWRDLELRTGQSLEFRLGDISAGKLVLAEIPWNNSIVAVVVKDVVKFTGGSYESQVFQQRREAGAQIAVFDAYHGKLDAKTWIRDQGDSQYTRSEELRYNNVVAVQSGEYEILLHAEDGQIKHRNPMLACDKEDYIVVRCGGQGPKREYNQETFIYPVSDASELCVAPTPPATPSPPPPPPPPPQPAVKGHDADGTAVMAGLAITIMFVVIGLMLYAAKE